MKQQLAVMVRGHKHEWMFPFDGDPAHIEHWRADGLDVVEVANTIPQSVAKAGLTRIWCFFEDLFRWRNPWKTK